MSLSFVYSMKRLLSSFPNTEKRRWSVSSLKPPSTAAKAGAKDHGENSVLSHVRRRHTTFCRSVSYLAHRHPGRTVGEAGGSFKAARAVTRVAVVVTLFLCCALRLCRVCVMCVSQLSRT